MKRSLLVLSLLLLSRAGAAAPQVVRCDQIGLDPYGFRERVFAQLDDGGKLLSIEDHVFYGAGDKGFPGNLSMSFDEPLSSVAADAAQFSYVKIIPEDGDTPDTRIDVTVKFAPGLAGRASLRAVYTVYDDGWGGVDEFEMECVR